MLRIFRILVLCSVCMFYAKYSLAQLSIFEEPSIYEVPVQLINREKLSNVIWRALEYEGNIFSHIKYFRILIRSDEPINEGITLAVEKYFNRIKSITGYQFELVSDPLVANFTILISFKNKLPDVSGKTYTEKFKQDWYKGYMFNYSDYHFNSLYISPRNKHSNRPENCSLYMTINARDKKIHSVTIRQNFLNFENSYEKTIFCLSAKSKRIFGYLSDDIDRSIFDYLSDAFLIKVSRDFLINRKIGGEIDKSELNRVLDRSIIDNYFFRTK